MKFSVLPGCLHFPSSLQALPTEKFLFDYHSSSAWHESGIPSLSMLEFIDQKIKKMNAN
jgi:hypothetical protein